MHTQVHTIHDLRGQFHFKFEPAGRKSMSNSAASIDRVPHPSSWKPLKSNFDGQCDSHWTTIYQTEVSAEHDEILEKLLNHTGLVSKAKVEDIPNDRHRRSSNPPLKRYSVAVKQVSPHLKRPPHDTLTEIQTLSKLNHPNIVPLLAYLEPPQHSNHCLFLPLYPTTLYNLLNEPVNHFTPSNHPAFNVLTGRIIRDIGSALIFLHTRSIAHRDLNPSNVALTPQGHATLIDFGTVWPGHPPPESNTLEFELGTMPYRAPELLFGSRSYSPFALDIWSFGALIAEFYTPMVPSEEQADRLQSTPSPPPHLSHNDGGHLDSGTALNWYCAINPTVTESSVWNLRLKYVRKTLFDGSCGDIGLVGSIFKLLGTPTLTSWPEAKTLPDFSKLNFHEFEKQDLRNHLPNLGYKLNMIESKLRQLSESKEDPNHLTRTADLENEMETEKIDMDQKILVIESFLNFNSSVRITSFQNHFGQLYARTGDSHSPSLDHPQSSTHPWLSKPIHDEDQLCLDLIKWFC